MYGIAKLSSDDFNEMEVLALEVRTDYELYDDYVDVFKFVQDKLNAILIKYSSLQGEQFEAAYSFSEDGFTIFEKLSNGIMIPYIFYNDMVPKSKQRYTLAHEVKHIVLGEEDPSIKEDAKAEYFAKVFLAPKILVLQNNDISENFIKERFDVSYECSHYILIGIHNRVKKYGTKQFYYEIEFLNNKTKYMSKKQI